MRGTWRGVVLAALVGVVSLAGALPAQAAATGSGSVYVVQGLTGTPVDVVVDDAVVAPGAAPGTVVGPVDLAAGTHTLLVRSGAEVLARASFDVRPGGSVDLVAHLPAQADAAPVVTVFANDLTPVAPGKARLVVAHTAAVPPADLLVDGAPIARNVANGESFTALVPARTFSVSAVPAATGGEPLAGPLDVAVPAGTLTRVFVVGDVSASTVTAVVQSLPVPVSGAQAPTVVSTGDGGQAASRLLDDPAALGALGAGGLLLALGATVGFGRRARGSGLRTPAAVTGATAARR